jgi:hypothetical protein
MARPHVGGKNERSTDMSEDLQELGERLRARAEMAREKGEPWVEKLEPELAVLPKGTVVAINCATDEYVLGKTRLEAADEFEIRFGKTLGWIHEVGGGVFLGGSSFRYHGRW